MSEPIIEKVSWREASKVYLTRPAITMFFLGYSAGLPILLIFSTLSIWLREVEVSRSDIGYFSWIALAYGFKYLWAPLIDAVKLPFFCDVLGRRRGWLLFSQILVIASICGIALNDASLNAGTTALMAAALAFSGATQDIVIDAYRIERADSTHQAALSATYVSGYRIAMIIGGAGALEIAGFLDTVEGYSYEAWKWAYLSMAIAMLVGFFTTLLIQEPELPTEKTSDPWLETIDAKINQFSNPIIKPFVWFFHKFIWPLVDFIQRYRRAAVIILLLIATYRVSDIVMGVMANTFYTDMGFEKQEIGRVSKTFGLIISIIGTIFGGVIVRRYGVMKILMIGAVLSSASNLLFAYMAYIKSNDLTTLALIISADNLSGGIAVGAFIAYLSSLVNKQFTATQYALYSSMMVLLPKFLGGFSGYAIDNTSYVTFFISTAFIGIPVFYLIYLASKLDHPK